MYIWRCSSGPNFLTLHSYESQKSISGWHRYLPPFYKQGLLLFFFFLCQPLILTLIWTVFYPLVLYYSFVKILLVSKHKSKEESDVHMNSSKLIINIKLKVYCSLKFIFSIIYFSCVRMHTPFLYESPHSNGKHRDMHLKSNTIINLLIDTYVPGQQTPWWIKHAANEKEY